MKEITNVSTEILKVHPRNTEFFDDISGENYERFKNSIKHDGILSPIIVSPDMTVLSGHQRLKACRDLNIKLVPVMIREDLTQEDEKLKILLAANFGRLKNDESKQRKVASEYVKLCGLKHGDNQWTDHNGLSLNEIAKQLGTSKTNLKRALRIENNLTDSIKELLDTGVISKTLASDVIAGLSPTEQEELLTSLPTTQKLTQKQVQEYIDKIKEKDNIIAGYELKLENISKIQSKKYTDQIDNLKVQIELKDKKISTFEDQKKLLERKAALNGEEAAKYKKLKSEIEFLSKQKDDISRQINSATELAGLTVKLQKLLEGELAPIKFKRCMESLNDTSGVALQNLSEVMDKLYSWLDEMNEFLPNINQNVVEVQNYKNV